MDKTLPKLLVVFVFLLLVKVAVQAQSWKPVGPDDNNEAFSGLIKYNNIVTSPDGVPYIVSSDANNSGKLTVKKFDGNNWSTVGAAGFSGGTTGLPSLAIDGVTPYVSFSDASNNGKGTVMKFDGNSWVTVGAVGFSTNSVGDVSLSFSGNTPYVTCGGTMQRFDGSSWVMIGASGFATSASGTVMSFDSNNIPYVAYLDYNNGNKATVKKFVGSTWVTVGTPATLAVQVSFFAFVFYGGTPFVAYTDANNTYKLSVKRFDGSNWVQMGNTNISTNTAAYISIASNGTPYVAYEDGGLGGKATVKKYNGQSWVTVGVEGFSVGPADNTSIALSGGTPYVAFENLNTKKGTAMLFDGSNWVVAGSSGSVSNGTANFTSLAFSNNIPYLAYSDASNSNKAIVKKYDGSTWTTVGTAGFSAGETLNNSLVFNGNTPYLSYGDNANSGKATVMKFDGSNWIPVGTSSFSSGTASYVSLAFSGATPYVAYGDYGNAGKVTVKKFDGSTWQTVGAAGFSGGAVNSLAFGIIGAVPYVAYADNSNGGKLTVMKFNGSTWTMVGTPSFSAGATTYLSLAFDGTTFYAAYSDSNASNKLTVKKFDGSNWVNVGAAGLSTGGANYVNFAFNGNTPYVSYADASFSNKITVKQFDGNNWITLGTPGLSFGGINSVSTALAVNNNKVYVAYDLNGIYVKSFGNPMSSNAQLSNLALSSGTLAPAFAAGTASFTTSVLNTTTSITLTPTLADATASVKVNGVAVTSGSASAAIPLTVGNNTIATVVTAQDGITTQTYTLTVNRAQAAQTITFAALPAKTYGDTDFALGATASSGLAVTYSSSDPSVASVDANGNVHLLSAGTVTLTAQQTGDNNYTAATPVAQMLTVKQANQAVTFASLPAKTYYGDADFSLNATSSSSLPFTYASSNTAVATVTAEGKVHVLTAGTTTISASQAGNTNYAATNATQNLTVLKTALTIKADDKTRTFGTANPALTITYTGFVNAETQTNLNALPQASTTATTASAAGTYPIAISGAASDNYAITYIPGTLTVTQAAQTITFGTLAAKAFGNPDFTPTATASSGLPLSFASSNPAVVTIINGQLHVVAPGTATITATQSGNTNYLAATPVSQTLAVVFSLPAKNFTVSATGESCKNSRNGEIKITAASNQNYTATIVVAGTSTAYPFTNQLSVKNLPAGIYPVCITIAGYPNYSQCFNVTVTQPQDLAVSAVVNPTLSSLSLSLAGASSYNISLNGATYTTTQSSVSLPLAAGKNSLQVSTSSICQGVYVKTIELPAGIIVYPNPVEQTLSLNIGNNKSIAATAEVYNMQGKMVYRGKTGVNQGNCAFDVPGLLPGNYVLKLVLDHSETRIKIIKK